MLIDGLHDAQKVSNTFSWTVGTPRLCVSSLMDHGLELTFEGGLKPHGSVHANLTWFELLARLPSADFVERSVVQIPSSFKASKIMSNVMGNVIIYSWKFVAWASNVSAVWDRLSLIRVIDVTIFLLQFHKTLLKERFMFYHS